MRFVRAMKRYSWKWVATFGLAELTSSLGAFPILSPQNVPLSNLSCVCPLWSGFRKMRSPERCRFRLFVCFFHILPFFCSFSVSFPFLFRFFSVFFFPFHFHRTTGRHCSQDPLKFCETLIGKKNEGHIGTIWETPYLEDSPRISSSQSWQ